MRIKFVVFYTEGNPNDEGSDLTKVVRTVRSLVEEAGHEFDAYTPKRLYQMGAGELVKAYPDKYNLGNNPNTHKFGLFSWKPFTILHALSTMEKDDVIFYLDANIAKYPTLRLVIQSINTIINKALNFCDFYIGRELTEQILKASDFCSIRQIEEIGGNSLFVQNFPLLIANNIIAKVSDFAFDILLDWLAMCRVKEYILPPTKEEEKSPNFKWFCADQSILNMIIARHIEEGLLPWFFPNICHGRSNNFSIPNNDHIQYLSHSTEVIWNRPKFREQHQKQIASTQIFLDNICNSKTVGNPWITLDYNLKDWQAADDATFTPLENNNYAFADGDQNNYHLIRIHDPKLQNMEIDLEIIAKKYPSSDPKIGMHIQQWGGIDLCTIYENNDKTIHPHTVFATATPLKNNFYMYHVRFFNYHDTLSIGTGCPQGHYLGKNNKQFEFSSIKIKRRFINPL